jgi:hypothetical protein
MEAFSGKGVQNKEMMPTIIQKATMIKPTVAIRDSKIIERFFQVLSQTDGRGGVRISDSSAAMVTSPMLEDCSNASGRSIATHNESVG